MDRAIEVQEKKINKQLKPAASKETEKQNEAKEADNDELN